MLSLRASLGWPARATLRLKPPARPGALGGQTDAAAATHRRGPSTPGRRRGEVGAYFCPK